MRATNGLTAFGAMKMTKECDNNLNEMSMLAKNVDMWQVTKFLECVSSTSIFRAKTVVVSWQWEAQDAAQEWQ
jgi:hypothetical protein